MSNINIKGLDKYVLTYALWHGADLRDETGKIKEIENLFGKLNLTLEQAALEYEKNDSGYLFGYILGKKLSVDISGDEFDPSGYDYENGTGAAQKVVDMVKNDPEFAKRIEEERKRMHLMLKEVAVFERMDGESMDSMKVRYEDWKHEAFSAAREKGEKPAAILIRDCKEGLDGDDVDFRRDIDEMSPIYESGKMCSAVLYVECSVKKADAMLDPKAYKEPWLEDLARMAAKNYWSKY